MNVSEFSKRVGLSPHTIRYYDKLGLIGRVHRQPNGHRIFAEKDVAWIGFVLRLKDTDMPLEKILQYAALREQGDETLLERKQLLVDHAKELIDKISTQQQHLKKLNDKIDLYDSALTGKIALD